MTENSINNTNQLLNQYYDYKLNINNQKYNDLIEINNVFQKNRNQVISNFDKVENILFNSTPNKLIPFFSDLITKYDFLVSEYQEKNRNYSSELNILSYFDIGETKHSFLLAKFLNPYSEHGQHNLFLKTFLKKLKIEKPEFGNWIVTAETGRIDVLIKRIEPHTVIVIENKSNCAVDQENQLYRYWYQEIYYPNRHLPISYTKEKSNNYKIIYLTPSDWKLPNDNSLQKPDYLPDEFPDKLPIEPEIWYFNKQIIEWLLETLDLIPQTNHRLREFVKQYIDYWN